jgi:hypothetical protein
MNDTSLGRTRAQMVVSAKDATSDPAPPRGKFEPMPDASRNILICSCDDTMKLDAAAIRTACGGARVTTAHQLCGAELARFRAIAGDAAPLTVGTLSGLPP